MLEERLHELETEYECGQEQMAFLNQKRAELRDTLLRISGAIQVLKELAGQKGREGQLETSPDNGGSAIGEETRP
jgi:hypothetical protein